MILQVTQVVGLADGEPHQARVELRNRREWLLRTRRGADEIAYGIRRQANPPRDGRPPPPPDLRVGEIDLLGFHHRHLRVECGRRRLRREKRSARLAALK